jgi:hypothetical protein
MSRQSTKMTVPGSVSSSLNRAQQVLLSKARKITSSRTVPPDKKTSTSVPGRKRRKVCLTLITYDRENNQEWTK